MNKLPAIDKLLPHGPEALALDAVMAWEPGEYARTRLKVRPDLILYDKALAGIPAWGGIEIMAQTLGIYAALCAGHEDTRPGPGYLVGVRHFKASRPLLEGGLELDIEAKCLQCEPHGLAVFDCCIQHRGDTLVSASLSVWRPRPAGGKT